MPPRLHVQFAAGPLEDALVARVGGDAPSPGGVASRDLERYYALLARELARVRLTLPEALAVAGACSGWYVGPDDGRHLWHEVEDYLRGLAADEPDSPLVQHVQASVLVAKLRALSPAQALAVVDAVERLARAPAITWPPGWDAAADAIGVDAAWVEALETVGLLRGGSARA